MESAAYSLKYTRSPKIEARMDSIIAIIAEAQQEEGYLYEDHICHNAVPETQGDRPYSLVRRSHELFNVGHMYEAAAAYYQATGKDNFLKIAEKNAQHVNQVFFVGDPDYNDGKPVMQVPGHEEIELGLCKLYRVTGNELYLQIAQKFLDIRGVTYKSTGIGTQSEIYAQEHAPVREQKEAVGHAVRAGYLYAAMAEVDALTGESEYTEALAVIWSNLVGTRMHITGGLGAIHGIEGFGDEYDLPNKEAYNETCAAVANVLFNYRMFLASGDAIYLDIMELSLFNNALAGIGLEGDSFFYENPLECDRIKPFNKGGIGRAEWFGLSCCPSNILRLILQIPGYMYSHTSDCIYLTLYGGSNTVIPLDKGNVAVIQQSAYPFDGDIRLVLDPEHDVQCFSLLMRIPFWTGNDGFVPGGLYGFIEKQKEDVVLKVNGEEVHFSLENGFAVINREWKSGDEVILHLPMPACVVSCRPEVKANRNRIAVVRGPLVYCAEGADNEVIGQVQRFYKQMVCLMSRNLSLDQA